VAIGGQVPEAELANYQLRLNAMTSGQGQYTIALSHYEAVPPTVQQTLMGQCRVREDA
jgi:elongation factor G